MKHTLLVTVAAVSLAGCSLRPADYADAASTAAAISQVGASEANPIVGVLGDDMAAPVALVLTAGARYAIDEFADEQNQAKYHHNLSSAKWGATCNNLAVLASAAPPAPIAIGILCGLAYYQYGAR